MPQARKKGVEEPGATPQRVTRPNAQRKWCPERQEKVLLTKKRRVLQNAGPGGLRLILERVGGEGVAAGEPKSVVVEPDTHGAVEGEEDGEGGDGSLVLADFEDIPAGSETSKSFPLEVPAALQEKKRRRRARRKTKEERRLTRESWSQRWRGHWIAGRTSRAIRRLAGLLGLEDRWTGMPKKVVNKNRQSSA